MALAAEDDRVCLVTGDLGFGVVGPFAAKFPGQFVNVGVAEQNMTGVAAGMALCGKVVFTYSIANFPTLRCLEQIRNDVCYHHANVKIVSVGGGLAYGALGASHHATEDIAVMRALPEMTVIAPGDPIEAEMATGALAAWPGPAYLRLGRSGEPMVHPESVNFQIGEAIQVTDGGDITLIATGTMLCATVQAAAQLAREGIAARVLSMHTIKPLDAEAVYQAARETRAIITIEEHSIIGGLGSAVAELLAEFSDCHVRFRRMALPPAFTAVGSREFLTKSYSLFAEGIVGSAIQILELKSPRNTSQIVAAKVAAAGQEIKMTYRVPFVDPREHYRRLKPKIDAAILDCLSGGDLIDRRQLRDFETRLAAFVGVKYAVGLNSGYHALQFSLLAAGIGPGDEVITVAHTFVATVSAIVNVGAHSVLVEVGSDYNMDADAFEAAITARTKAVLPVSLNGHVCQMDRIVAIAEKHNLVVIEDSAQALGAELHGHKAGSLGLTGCFSFYPFKILGGFGDGGAVTTNDANVAQMVRRLRYNGEDRETGEYHYHGQTALLDNVQAAVLNVKLGHLPKWIEHRRAIAALYHEGLQEIPELRLPQFDGSGRFDVFQNYVIRTEARDGLREHLMKHGVETLVHWPKPMWKHENLGLQNPGLAETERICREVISLPMSVETTREQVEIVVDCVRSFYRSVNAPVRYRAAGAG